MRFDGKVVVVTGAGTGIGEATARYFVSAGASVVLNGRDREKLEKSASRYPADRALIHPGDVSERAGAAALVAKAIERFSRLDVLVNNASTIALGTLDTHSDSDWRQTFETNVDTVFHCCQAASPHLQAGAAIVNISSVSGIGGDIGWLAYNAAKAAVSNLTRALAIELGPQSIRVNAVMPSLAWTPRTAMLRDNAAMAERQIARIPLGRIANASEIAAAIAFLASEEASFITGINMPVDGGLTASSGLASFF
ncbi:Short-chain dehydrogenase/reductase SDR precursor [Bradyrhizobium sp. STM 3843]|uniref:SDR family NAD(P)-dependent oxidoreductase n=1 Tax=Bradyrhizobium sp. STM 3843 TaxID=551947 RepID=UPI000240AE5C|nr:SDR family NAD(P)-dependent oxidoreductase [Bradyrhizobium sp. STM 3843]CCE05351.1 Short-chain dehydrogenase/reductase SDR precursor [Bradyrhizobium sp. STM 3843]